MSQRPEDWPRIDFLITAYNPVLATFPRVPQSFPKREVKHLTGNFWTKPAQKFPLSCTSALSHFLSGELSEKPSLSCVRGRSCDRLGNSRGIAQGSQTKIPPVPQWRKLGLCWPRRWSRLHRLLECHRAGCVCVTLPVTECQGRR